MSLKLFMTKSQNGGGYGINPDALVFSRHKDEIREVYEELCGERSKRIYLEALKKRLTWDTFGEDLVTDDQYFALKEF